MLILEALQLMFLLVYRHQTMELLSLAVYHPLGYCARLLKSEVNSAMEGLNLQIIGDSSCSNSHPIGELMHSRCELGGVGFEDQEAWESSVENVPSSSYS